MRPTPSAYRDPNGGQVRPVAEDIDPRILYSADATALAGDMALGPEPAAAIVQTEPLQAHKTQRSTLTPEENTRTLVVVDRTLNDVDLLLSELSARQITSNGIDVITVWEVDNDIYYRISSVSGATNGSQVKLSNPTDADRHDPTVAMATDGSFVIAWTGEDQDGNGVYAQQFYDSGNAKAGEFRVNATTSRDQFDPSVAIRNDGGFAISWTSNTVIGPGVRVSIYDANGISIQSERAPWISVEPTFASSIAVNQTDNSMALVFTNTAILSTGKDTLISMRLDPGGSLVLGSSYQWSQAIADISEPAINVNSSGAYAIAATVAIGGQRDIGLFTMTPVGSSDISALIQVNQVSGQDHARPDVALSNTGDVLVAWESNQGPAGQDVYARQFNLSASPVGFETLVNQQTSGTQHYSSVVIHGQSASIVWSGMGPGDNDGVFRRLVDLATPGIIAANQNPTTSENGQFTDIGFRLSSQPIAALSTGVSIGYVLWLLRGGALLSSLMASMPAWRSMDPLAVLSSLESAHQDTGDDDSLESMLEKSRQANDAEQSSPTPEVVGEEIV